LLQLSLVDANRVAKDRTIILFVVYSVYGRISVRFFPQKFSSFHQHRLIHNFSLEIVFISSLNGATGTHAAYTAVLDEFLCVVVVFTNVPTQNSMFYTWFR